MAYRNEWWFSNYTEYNKGGVTEKTWPNVMEQYRKPNNLLDVRHTDLPVENYQSMLYYEKPRLLNPVYEAHMRRKPYTVPRYYPGKEREDKPVGYFGRMYYEHGSPAFKYEGPKKDDLFWLERPKSGK